MDDFEEDTLLSPAFEVDRALIEQGVITSPRDGLHFLANVILERRTCLDVVTASLPNSVNNQNIFATEVFNAAIFTFSDIDVGGLHCLIYSLQK